MATAFSRARIVNARAPARCAPVRAFPNEAAGRFAQAAGVAAVTLGLTLSANAANVVTISLTPELSFKFTPSSLNILTGSPVEFVYEGNGPSAKCQLLFADIPEGAPRFELFRPPLAVGEKVSINLNVKGDYTYACVGNLNEALGKISAK